MSKFLNLIKSVMPEKEKTVVAKRNIPSRERPRPSPGANAPAEIHKVSKNTENPVDDKVKGLLSLLFSKDVNAQQAQPDVIRIKTGNGTVLVKVLGEEDSEQDAYGTAVSVVDRSADNPEDPANPMSKQTRLKVNTQTTKANKFVNDKLSELDKQMSASGAAKTI
ncbi:MAG: hypothetical protein QN632_02430 [Nitrososphaeraceae archaeon]|jgi:hypothetical protein|nr:hypothetical protein [Nitrososphaeraceae archaeon]